MITRPPSAIPASLPVDTFPQTRYQGSKRKLASAIADHLRELTFDTVLDAFGGTGVVSYELKRAGKRVTYNDLLAFNHQIGIALIENETVRLDDTDIEFVCQRQAGATYDDFIARTFEDIYFTTDENRWLDMAVNNIGRLTCRFKRALAWFALCQSAIAKRPYNLFHRRNLYMRLANVQRSFGNKVGWDRSFLDHFRVFADEANRAVVDTGSKCQATCGDALATKQSFDLVYVDPPYVNRAGVGVDYRDFYHFLEGMLRYNDWPEMLDFKSKHRRLTREANPWSNAATCHEMFRTLFDRFRDSILVVSYRSDGTPTIDELSEMLRSVKGRVRVIDGPSYQYALSKNRKSREMLLTATD